MKIICIYLFLFLSQITPNDAYRYDDDKCQCYEIGKPPLPSRQCSSKCKTTETEYFNVSGKAFCKMCSGSALLLLLFPMKNRQTLAFDEASLHGCMRCMWFLKLFLQTRLGSCVHQMQS